MQFEDQHIEAIRPTITAKHEVSATIFDDKVKDMGRLEAWQGRITIQLYSLPSIMGSEGVARFVSEAIAVAIREAMLAHPEAFDPYAK